MNETEMKEIASLIEERLSLLRKALPTHKSHKTVHAFKILKITECADGSAYFHPAETNLSGLVVLVSAGYMEKHRPKAGGYYVLYEDGYESWSPAEAFEGGYALNVSDAERYGGDIGDAVRWMSQGKHVTRPGWNGKGMYLWYRMGRKSVADAHAWQPFVAMRTVDGTFVPWLCSQTDLLANDWMIAPEDTEDSDDAPV